MFPEYYKAQATDNFNLYWVQHSFAGFSTCNTAKYCEYCRASFDKTFFHWHVVNIICITYLCLELGQ